MRRAPLCALLLFSAAYAGAQNAGVQLLEKFESALYSAKTLSVTYTVQLIGDSATTYKLELAKPNLAKIDSPTELIVADGTKITTYDKAKKTYYKRAQTDQELSKLLAKSELSLWAGFFNENVAAKYTSVHSLGTKARKGITYNAVEFNMPAGRPTVVTYYLHETDFIARQAEYNVTDGSVTDIVIFDAKSVAVGTSADPAKYAFAPPDGSRELTEAELNSAKWYTDLDEAMQVAKSTNRMLMVFCSADW